MKRTNMYIGLILILIVGLLSLGGLEQTNLKPLLNNTISLNEGVRFTKTIVKNEKHHYSLYLKNGEAIIAVLEQLDKDIVIDIFDPKKKLIKSIVGTGRVKKIDITSKESGKYKFVIHRQNKNSKNVKYLLYVKQILTLEDNIKRFARKELPTKTLFNLWQSTLTDSNAIDAFISKHQQKHFIEPIEGNDTDMLVTYFCVPNDNTEYVMQSGGPDFLGLRFKRLMNSKLFFVTQRVPKEARFNYGFNYFNLDKAGPNDEIRSSDVEHSYDGIVEMPNASKQIYIPERENVGKGTLLVTSIQSKILNEKRKITIHTPVNYNSNIPHNLLIVFDGESYGGVLNRRSKIPTATIIDNLTADNKISPTVTVLVWSMGKRSKDLISHKFGEFIADELISWARLSYNIHPKSDRVILAGSSRGGFAASSIALQHSDVIGNVLSQSGSYWIKGTKDENHWIYPSDDGKLIDAYKKNKLLPIKFYMDVGLYDAGASMLGMNRQFRDILKMKGYKVDYREFKGGHSYVNWRGTLSDGLISLIGTKK